MISYTFSEILLAVCISFFFGLLFGGAYHSFSAIIASIKNLLLLEINVLKAKSISEYKKGKIIDSSTKKFVGRNVYDFFFFLIFGLSYLIICYVITDGVFRFYLFAITVITFFFSVKTIGSLFQRIILWFFYFIYSFAFALAYILNYPLKLLIGCLKSPISRLCGYLLKNMRSIKGKLAFKRKHPIKKGK